MLLDVARQLRDEQAASGQHHERCEVRADQQHHPVQRVRIVARGLADPAAAGGGVPVTGQLPVQPAPAPGVG